MTESPSKGRLHQTVETCESFAAALDDAIATEIDETVLTRFLAHNTWDDRVRQMLSWTDEVLTSPPCLKSFNPLAVEATG